MSEQTIESRLINVISAQLGVDKSSVVPTANLVEDLGADSLDEIELIMAVEKEFGIEIIDEVAVDFKTVQNVIDHVTEVAAP
jgi:acyl carrier protein